MSDFLLELASEEIPARMQTAAAEQLARRVTEGLVAAGLGHGTITADATPRRLWLIAEGLAGASAGSIEERRGPRADAPPAAIEGFLRSTGLAREALEARETPKGVFLYAQIASEGRTAAAILAGLIPGIVGDFAWPKSMRWGAASASTASPRWVRPLTGIVALLDGEVIACEAHGIASGRVTCGHRIHAPEPIAISSAATYAAQLRTAKVIVASVERRSIIAAGAAVAAGDLAIIPDEGLIAENAGLTEWPIPLLGRFDPAFLGVPREVIQLTMRTNQKYFACSDASGALAPAFVCVANLEASDGGAAIIAGNERVLTARLSDAKFFWDQDVATVKAGGLEAFLPKLETIVFHEKLGTIADKVDRVAKLARWLAESGAVPGDADLAERAARLAKADLVSATVGEFPEVQGLAGAYLSRIAGRPPEMADAIRDHYKPAGQKDSLPTGPVSVAVALADKLDTLLAFHIINEKPTGSRDPFALRRSALGVCAILLASSVRLPLRTVLEFHYHTVFDGLMAVDLERKRRENPGGLIVQGFGHVGESPISRLPREVVDFLADRLKIQQREAGVRHDLIDAVFALDGEDDLVRLLARVRALQSVLATDDGTNLLAGVKRAANILRIEEDKDAAKFPSETDPALFTQPAEITLAAALDTAGPTIAAAVHREDFTAAMAALAALRPAVDGFFDAVIVNAPDQALRLNRLGLLARLRAAAASVADFSRIEA